MLRVYIGEVTLKGRPYKDLDSPTPIVSFWDVVLLMTYAHNTLPVEDSRLRGEFEERR